jgi:phosphoribosylamine-glycine ligase
MHAALDCYNSIANNSTISCVLRMRTALCATQANGGRVLAVTGVGSDLTAAMTAAYKGVEAITFTPSHYRKDIGYRAKQAPLRIGGTCT